MKPVTKLLAAGVLAVAGLALTADRASAQYYHYNYGVTPFGGYSNYAYTPGLNTYAVNPYPILNPYAVTPFGTGYPTYNYQSRYYSNPFTGSTGVYNSYYQSPSAWGPGGYQYNYYRWR